MLASKDFVGLSCGVLMNTRGNRHDANDREEQLPIYQTAYLPDSILCAQQRAISWSPNGPEQCRRRNELGVANAIAIVGLAGATLITEASASQGDVNLKASQNRSKLHPSATGNRVLLQPKNPARKI